MDYAKGVPAVLDRASSFRCPSNRAMFSVRIAYSYVSIVTVAAGTARIMFVPMPA